MKGIIRINSFSHLWRQGKDQFHYKRGNPPQWCYMGCDEWYAFQDHVHQMNSYRVPCEPPTDCDAIYEDVKIIQVRHRTHFNFA